MTNRTKLALQDPRVEIASTSVREIPLLEINIDDETFQYRFNAKTNGLKESLASEGQRLPIDIKSKKKPYVIVDGFRRVLAARDLGWDLITAKVHEGLSANDAFRLAFTQNVCRKNLTPMEKAQAIVLAEKRGLTKKKLAKLFGLSERMIERYRTLTTLPQVIQECMDGKIVTMAHAKLLFDARISNPQDWSKRIEQEKLSAPRLKRLLRKRLNNGAQAKKVYITKEKNHFTSVH